MKYADYLKIEDFAREHGLLKSPVKKTGRGIDTDQRTSAWWMHGYELLADIRSGLEDDKPGYTAEDVWDLLESLNTIGEEPEEDQWDPPKG